MRTSIFPSYISYRFIKDHNIDIIESIKVIAYEPAFGIIGDPAKRDPHTRQSADHSMVYILSTMLRKAFDIKDLNKKLGEIKNLDGVW